MAVVLAPAASLGLGGGLMARSQAPKGQTGDNYKEVSQVANWPPAALAYIAMPAPVGPRFTKDAVIIDDVPNVHQMPSWPTGCEVVALKMLAEFYGVNKSVDQWIDIMPRGDIYWSAGRMYGPDPREAFAGNPYSAHSYGVYHQPMINMLTPYFGDRVINMTDRRWGDYEDMVLAGNPVMIWGTINNLPIILRDTWVTPAGDVYEWRGNWHAMVLIGFSKTEVLVNDPYTGTTRRFDRDTFIERWAAMGQQGIAVRPE
jgi:uncharacterized protein YvpB